MLVLHRASACLALMFQILGGLAAPSAHAQALPRPASAQAPSGIQAVPASASAAVGAGVRLAPASGSARPVPAASAGPGTPAAPTAAGKSITPAAAFTNATPTAAPGPVGPAAQPSSASAAPASTASSASGPGGSVGGRLLLVRGDVPKVGVVYLEGIAQGSWTLPKERVMLSTRVATFYPDFLVIPVGQTVQISNNDRLMHSPFSISPAKPFELSRHAPGDTHSIVFDRVGVVDVFCNIHETMQTVIVVVPSTYYALLAPDGSFQLNSVPPGRYRAVGYAPQMGQSEQVSLPIEVRSRERTTVRLQFGQIAPLREKPR